MSNEKKTVKRGPVAAVVKAETAARDKVAAAIGAWSLMRAARNGLEGVAAGDDTMLTKAAEVRAMIEAVS